MALADTGRIPSSSKWGKCSASLRPPPGSKPEEVPTAGIMFHAVTKRSGSDQLSLNTNREPSVVRSPAAAQRLGSMYNYH
jgi:hypothetical protein